MDDDELARMVPPWIAFPEITPDDLPAHTRQGRAETYFDDIWRPFWSALTDAQRTAYCNHWGATPEWRDALSMFDIDPNFDIERDARESEAYLKEHQTPPSSPFWKRLFRRR